MEEDPDSQAGPRIQFNNNNLIILICVMAVLLLFPESIRGLLQSALGVEFEFILFASS